MRHPPRSDYKFTSGNMAVDLHVSWDRFIDPGQYPSGAGGGPLPPGPWYPEDVSGTVTLTLSSEDRADITEYPSVKDWVNDGQIGNSLLDEVDVKITWEVVLATDEKLVVEPGKVESCD